jgi:FKBP-type peptidyl-prolyl cis-trans isomerase FkpA
MVAAVKTASGLIYEDLQVGDGDVAEKGKLAMVHYTGWLSDAAHTRFYSSKLHNKPFSFLLGSGRVISGWDEGVQGMRVGGVRKLIVPPDLGYGAQGAAGVIPPNATLIFEVELLALR